MVAAGSLVFIIVNRGKANALLHRAQQEGARRGTILLGEGTIPSRLADFLGISQTGKEVLLIAVPKDAEGGLYGMLRAEFQLHKRYKGIAFSVPYRMFDPDSGEAEEGYDRGQEAPYLCLMTVVERGLGGECMKVARRSGAQGGTILSGHGAGVLQEFLFPLNIEPQKDLVLIVSAKEAAPQIREAIYTGMSLEKKGSGLLFALPVTRTCGLYEERRQDRQAGL